MLQKAHSVLKTLEIKASHFIISLFALIAVSQMLLVPVNADSWNHINNLKGPLQISSDGSTIAFISERADSGDKVMIENSSGNHVWDFTQTKELNSIALSGNGKYLAVVGNGVYLLSLANKQVLWSWTTDGKNTVAISSDGNWIAAGGYSAKIYVFKKESSEPYKSYNLGEKEDYPHAVAISDDGKSAAASANLGVYAFDTNNSAIKWQYKTAEKLDHLKFSADGQYLFGIAAHSVYFWDKNKSMPLWQKKWDGSLIGTGMTANGDKIVVSHDKGISIFNNQGKELRTFAGSFGNSDVLISQDGKYFYVNDGSKRLYAFDDSYSTTDLRPFRIINDINSGGEERFMGNSSSGSTVAYPSGDTIIFQQQDPAILALSPGIPIVSKNQTLNMGVYVTNPSSTAQKLKVEVRLSLPSSAQFWDTATRGLSSKESLATRSKLLNYTLENLPDNKLLHSENITLDPGASAEQRFSATVPDLSEGASFTNFLSGDLSALNPASLVSKMLGVFKGPLSKLIGSDDANIAITATGNAITASGNQMTYPVMGMGTVTLTDSAGNYYDQDSFYFMYLK